MSLVSGFSLVNALFEPFQHHANAPSRTPRAHTLLPRSHIARATQTRHATSTANTASIDMATGTAEDEKATDFATCGIFADLDANPEVLRLPDLPIELVIRILEYAVIVSFDDDPQYIDDALASKRKSFRNSDPPSIAYREVTLPLVQPAITRTCRLLRNEGLSLFYGCNASVFHVSGFRVYTMIEWLASLQACHRAQINLQYCTNFSCDTLRDFFIIAAKIVRLFNTKSPEDYAPTRLIVIGVPVDEDGLVVVHKVGEMWYGRIAFTDGPGIKVRSFEGLVHTVRKFGPHSLRPMFAAH